jgi:enamine deaminase RidA (YjgF/YER057c/UK114 family)
LNRRFISSGSTFEAIAGYSRAVVDGEWVFVSGCTGYDYATMTIAPDVAEQTRQAFRNVAAALAAAGARPEHVVKATMYVVGLTDEVLARFAEAMNDALDGRPFPPTASTLVGVERLAYAEMLVEIDAIAVV